MARRNMSGETGEGSLHSDRPWVYFMIDCFLLITNFFIVTFRFKAEEPILPNRMPPCGIPPCRPVVPPDTLAVHVSRSGEAPVYEFMARQVTMPQLAEVLANARSGDRDVAVKISYEKEVPWGDVMGVFNECAKVQIVKCGLVPLRAAREARPSRGSD